MSIIRYVIGLAFEYRYIYIFQTNQRLSDSWRGVIGDAGLNTVEKFIDERKNLLQSDNDRQSFAKQCLTNYWFLYKDSDSKGSGGKQVC
jgi:hypothetical protein